MQFVKFTGKFICVIALFCIIGGCTKEIETDPCLSTKWPQPKLVELKLAVHMVDPQPLLPEGTPNSDIPADFEKMIVNGTIEKVECSSDKGNDPVSLGNTYIEKGVDLPVYLGTSGLPAYWIGHVVYVYEFDNDEDHLNINLMVKITMQDNQSYQCVLSQDIYYAQIIQMPMEMYHYVVIDIYSDNWIKI